MTNELMKVVVSRKTREAEDICSFELVHPEGNSLPAFSPGSHIDVHISEQLLRQYSLCNDPAETHRYVLGVLREPESSGGSIAMHENVQEGQEIQISYPRNNFHLEEDAGYSLLLGGGIGITPILSMARKLAASGRNFEMHYCTRSKERCAFHDEISRSAFADKVNFHFDDGPEDQLLDIPALLQTRPEDARLYVCGPKGFMDAVISNAEKSWPADTIHREYFSADPSAGKEDDSFAVRINSSGELIQVPADLTIVEALLEKGIEIPVSCEQGICGTCLTRIIEGTPEHRDLFLSDAEHEANDQMTPCCSRALSDILVLDL